MDLSFRLKEEDYLQFQLYIASKSKRIQKKRKKSWILVSLSMFVLSALFYVSENPFLFKYFIAFGIITIIFYPFHTRREYKKHYENFIKENYGSRLKITSDIVLQDDRIAAKDENIEAPIMISEMEKIIEISTHIFIQLKHGITIIFPLNQIDDIESLKHILQQWSNAPHITYVIEKNWKWK